MPKHARSSVRPAESLRQTGIPVLGKQAWGSHFSLFYKTTQDLLDVHAGYFRAGLEDGEFCMWALSPPLSDEAVIKSLRGSIPDFDRHLREDRIALVPGRQWYLDRDGFDPRRVIAAWHRTIETALARGFSGVRLSGNAFWFETRHWKAFAAYEAELHRSLAGRKILVLCTYPLRASRAADMLDVTRTHHFTIVRRDGEWEFLEASDAADIRVGSARAADAIPHGPSEPFAGRTRLTDREQIVLAHLVKGASSKEAARALKISPRTVEFHRGNIMRKLGARNLADLLGIVLGTR